MSYLDLELSQQDGDPVELFEFRQGSEFWRYTSASVDLTKTGQNFVAESVKRSQIKQTDDMSKGGLSLTFPRTNLFASAFLSNAPEGVTTVTVWKKHFSDSVEDYIAYWKGRVLKASASVAEITIDCESVFTSLKRPGLRARYERGCRHGLYSAACTLSMSGFQLIADVIGEDVATLTIAAAASYPDGNFTGGVITDPNGVHRLIVSHTGEIVKTSKPFPSSINGQEVKLYPGCDKLKSTCITKFNNLDNFGGFPYIPYINPFGGKSVV